jgi:hypothetical protein
VALKQCLGGMQSINIAVGERDDHRTVGTQDNSADCKELRGGPHFLIGHG